ncbi:glycosyltransferase family 2 protein [Bradyrhizobium sp. NBAIM20]|uniref:glycosyltransferase family 2 protein n=1 Tax=unclassified Bradyrhizobium TaxID=2631580 RepID=UPI001CD24D57|nr:MULTISPECIES: glycosyltransferase family 2 protein [unclassified Bradyrhizobium]MCA1414678.1 glycosyltransferase family 2 protein [Bradyrhizobium sp. NBAIM20]MCA1461867.1 glycosyltransferase family 2 protein [Bradyrhizobium sp. NBAIM18]
MYCVIDQLISVIVPAFNADSTIRETVKSALDQTYRNIEVIIVDDGSTDDTKAIAAELIKNDGRVRYIHQQNGGVASARNRGIAEAKGDFVATLDSDDLWYPTKLERQMERFASRGSNTALVYAWCCWIDPSGVITGAAPPCRLEGKILPQMCLGNVVISASNALIRREAVIAAEGFDETLRARGAQGCEDWKLYLQIADMHEIGMVPEYLIGYRISAGSMSDDFSQMMRSRRLVEAEFLPSHPNLARQFALGELVLARALAVRAINLGQYRAAFELLTKCQGGRVRAAASSLIWIAGGVCRRLFKYTTSGRHQPKRFLAGRPNQQVSGLNGKEHRTMMSVSMPRDRAG